MSENLEQEEASQGIAEKKVVRGAKNKERARLERQHNNLAVVLNTYDGRAFIWDTLCLCVLHHSSPFEFGPSQRHEGNRDLGINIEAKVFTVSSELYRLMRDEAIQRDKVEL